MLNFEFHLLKNVFHDKLFHFHILYLIILRNRAFQFPNNCIKDTNLNVIFP